MNGMQMLLGQLGIDPKKITDDFTALSTGVQTTLGKIEQRLEGIEKTQATILTLVQELTAWKRIQTHQPQLSLPAQPQAVPAAQPPQQQ